MGERLKIMEEVFGQSNFATGNALYELIRPYYFWSGMLSDCIALAT